MNIKKILKKPLFWIFIFALLLRLAYLSDFPWGFHVDEAKVGWNAYSIIKSGLDDHNQKPGLYYDSFGDYRPTGIFLAAIPSVLLFGNTIFATRFMSAFFGALTVIIVSLFLDKLEKKNRKILGLTPGNFAAIFMAVSAWHIEVSRATSEAAISLFFGVLSMYLLLLSLEKTKIRYLIFSVFSIFVANMFYHSMRLLAPFFYVSFILFFYKILVKKGLIKRFIITAVLVFVITAFFSSTSGGFSRLSQVSVLKSIDSAYELQRIRDENANPKLTSKVFDNKVTVYLKAVAMSYGNYFSSGFLIGYDARPYRYATPGVGLLNYAEILLLILGLAQIAKGKNSFLPLLFLLLSPIPAAITAEDSPNLHRAFIMTAFLVMIEAQGLIFLTNLNKKIRGWVFFSLFTVTAVFLVYFLHMYYSHSFYHKPFYKNLFVDSPTFRNSGMMDLVQKVNEKKDAYDKIVVTNFPDSPYPWYAFFNKLEPGLFNKSTYKKTTNERVWQNIVFTEDKCPSEYAFTKYSDKKLLVIVSYNCAYDSQIKAGLPAKVTEKIKRKDGSEEYIFMERI